MRLSQKGKTEREREKNISVFLMILMLRSIREIALFISKISERRSKVIDIYCGEVSTTDSLGTVTESIVGKNESKTGKMFTSTEKKTQYPQRHQFN